MNSLNKTFPPIFTGCKLQRPLGIEIEARDYYTGRDKKRATLLLSIPSQMDFQNSSTGTLCGQFAITWLLHIPPHCKCVSTLLCEISMKFAYI